MGLVGLLCAALGAQQVVLTDYEPQVLQHMGHNATLNGLQHCCTSQRLDWQDPSSSLRPEQRGTWRVVVAADVLYASVVVQPLLETLKMMLHEEGERGAAMPSPVCRCVAARAGSLQMRVGGC